MPKTQNYENHVRWFPLFHFVVSPILFFNLVWQSVRLYQEPSWDRAEFVLLSIGLLLLGLAARMQALMVQNRLIKLEESLRYQKILSPDMAFQAEQLPLGSKFALRFASDEELPELIQKAINGEFKNSKEILPSRIGAVIFYESEICFLTNLCRFGNLCRFSAARRTISNIGLMNGIK
jgi:Family of unknown function (DUF6526)